MICRPTSEQIFRHRAYLDYRHGVPACTIFDRQKDGLKVAGLELLTPWEVQFKRTGERSKSSQSTHAVLGPKILFFEDLQARFNPRY